MKIFRTVLRAVIVFVEVMFLYQLILRLVRRYAKFPAPAVIGRVLDSRVRRFIQPPRQIIQRSGAQPGMQVLEIGCGSGAFTTYMARAVGEQGKVFALDIQEEMLEQVAQKLALPENQDVQNVELVKESAYNLPFKYETLDLVYMIAVFQEIPQQERVLAEIKRVLKPGGILAITEFLPDPDYPQVTTTIRAGKAAGFDIDDVPGNYFDYTVRFIKR